MPKRTENGPESRTAVIRETLAELTNHHDALIRSATRLAMTELDHADQADDPEPHYRQAGRIIDAVLNPHQNETATQHTRDLQTRQPNRQGVRMTADLPARLITRIENAIWNELNHQTHANPHQGLHADPANAIIDGFVDMTDIARAALQEIINFMDGDTK